jgi:nucleotide-binding universal stress UspA family protein
MSIPTRILVPFDFSALAKRALRYAGDLVQALPKCELAILHVVEPILPINAAWARRLRLATTPPWRDELDLELGKVARKAQEAAGVPVRAIVRTGKAFREIIQAAKDGRANLIVMGSSGYDSHHASMFGTTAERVARDAPCPVLLVGKSGKLAG